MNVSSEEMKRDPSAILDRVLNGETLILTQKDLSVAEIRPIGSVVRRPRPFGLAAGSFIVPDDFDDPLPDDVLDQFER
jgi:antitoxin (DNA-binding transcriptional repressor) of toxin-antitoxin stability system